MKRAIPLKLVALLLSWTLLANALPVGAQPVPGNLHGASAAPATVTEISPTLAPSVGTAGAFYSDGEACQNGHFVSGIGIYIVQPYFVNNPAFTVVRTLNGGADTHIDRTDLRHHMSVAPELWLGYVGENGMGARLRWWYFRQGTDATQTVGAGTANDGIFLESAAPLGISSFTDNDSRPATMAVTSKLELQVWDLEGTQSVRSGSWDFLYSCGLRFAHINQHYNAYIQGDSGSFTGAISDSLVSGHSFHGLGPVLGLEARRPLADSGLALFGTLRGALLFGSAKQTAVDTFNFGSDPAETTTAQDHRTRVMPVCEVELGVEYRRALGSAQAFGQIALVGQDWIGAGNASRSTQNNFIGVPDGGGSIIDNDLGLFGLTLRLGVDF